MVVNEGLLTSSIFVNKEKHRRNKCLNLRHLPVGEYEQFIFLIAKALEDSFSCDCKVYGPIGLERKSFICFSDPTTGIAITLVVMLDLVKQKMLCSVNQSRFREVCSVEDLKAFILLATRKAENVS